MARTFEVARGLVAVALLAGCGAGVVDKAPQETAGTDSRSGLAGLSPGQQLPRVSIPIVPANTGENPATDCRRADGGGSASLEGEFAFVPDATTARIMDTDCAPGVRCAFKIAMVRYPSEAGTTEFLNVFVGNDRTVELRPGPFLLPVGIQDESEGPHGAVDYTFVPRPQDPGGDRPLGIDHRRAMSGVVEVNAVTRDWISGSFDVSFGFNGAHRLKGTFCAPVVPDL